MSIWNGFYRATVPAIVAVFCCHLNAANAATITVDYSDLASTLGDRDAVSNFGTTADVKFSYSTVNDFGVTLFPYVRFWEGTSPEFGLYSGDEALYSEDGTFFKVVIEVVTGTFKDIAFDLGNYLNAAGVFNVDLRNEQGSLISVSGIQFDEADQVVTVGQFANLSASSITFLFGKDFNVGLLEVRYTLNDGDDGDDGDDNGPSPVPVPGALPLLASGIGGLWMLSRRSRNAV